MVELRKIQPIKNKKGDIPSILYVVIILFIIAIVFVFANRLNDSFFTAFEDIMEEDIDLNNTYAHTTIQDIHDADNSVWDYAFLFIALGIVLVMGLSSFTTRVSPVFFWIYVIFALVILVVGVIVSNMWQSIADNADMTDTIARFPITNALLGSYYPTFVVFAVVIVMVLLFGKFPGQQPEV